ncbi:MAG TPA: KilA-N domain-containing protein [Nitrosarchaeum sp.]|nr:KilA-N domain-containing protein [Nitrosarchaeum sp.]
MKCILFNLGYYTHIILLHYTEVHFVYMSLTNIIFEFIDTEKKYAKGKYGEFEVLIMVKNGYVNATKMCNEDNKLFSGWSRNKKTKMLIEEVSRSMQICMDLLFIEVMKGKNFTRGTYVHPLLVPHVATWISPVFAVKVSQIVNEYLVQEYKKTIMEKEIMIKKKEDKINSLEYKLEVLLERSAKAEEAHNKILAKNKKMSKKINNLTNQNDELLEKNDVVIDKLDTICDDRVVRPKSSDDTHSLVVLKSDSEEYPYHAIRRLRKAVDSAIRRYQLTHEDSEVILHINYTPNAINLFSRIKSKLSEDKKLKYKGNDITLRKNYTEEEFISDLRSIHNERFDY